MPQQHLLLLERTPLNNRPVDICQFAAMRHARSPSAETDTGIVTIETAYAQGLLARAGGAIALPSGDNPNQDSFRPLVLNGIKRMNRSLRRSLPQAQSPADEYARAAFELNVEVRDLRYQPYDRTKSLKETLFDEIGDLRDTVYDGIEAIYTGMAGGFEAMTRANQQTGEAIVAAIYGQNRQAAVSHRERACQKLLSATVQSPGTERAENFDDALKWYSDVVADKEGEDDPKAHFHLGWILWQVKGDLSGAEWHFRACVRHIETSRDTVNSFYPHALWHLAHLYYLQGRFRDAYEIIGRGASLKKAPLLFDQARYATLLGQKAEALTLLEESVRSESTLLYAALAEPADLADIKPHIVNLGLRLQREQETEQRRLVEQVRTHLGRIRKIHQTAERYCQDASLVPLYASLLQLGRLHSTLTLDYPGFRSVLPGLRGHVADAEREIGKTVQRMTEEKERIERELTLVQKTADDLMKNKPLRPAEPAAPPQPPQPPPLAGPAYFVGEATFGAGLICHAALIAALFYAGTCVPGINSPNHMVTASWLIVLGVMVLFCLLVLLYYLLVYPRRKSAEDNDRKEKYEITKRVHNERQTDVRKKHEKAMREWRGRFTEWEKTGADLSAREIALRRALTVITSKLT